MRRVLEIVSQGSLVLLVFVTVRALYGPARLPDRIPTHFNAAGQADGWGPPMMLLIFPVFAMVIYLLMSRVSRFPAAFNFPVRVTPLNRQRLEELALSMIAWLKAEVVVFFTWLAWSAIGAARSPEPHLSPALMPMLLVAVFSTCIVHIVAMFRAARMTPQR
jgi:uncharacterized membrane protein